MKKKAKQGDIEIYVVAFKELINKAVSNISREEATSIQLGSPIQRETSIHIGRFGENI